VDEEVEIVVAAEGAIERLVALPVAVRDVRLVEELG
jgi:hypothetical protein